jgi:hypothetical protein
MCQEFENNREGKWKKCTPLISEHFLVIQTAMPAVCIRLPQNALQKSSAAVSNIYQALLNTLNKR